MEEVFLASSFQQVPEGPATRSLSLPLGWYGW
jgi:hypothetical protein